MATTSKTEVSIKHLAIGKANAQMVAAIAIASFVTVFCLVASQSLWSTQRYQSRVIAAKEKANTQLKANEKAVDSLVASYKSFVTTGNNVLGGSTSGTGDNDGDNAWVYADRADIEELLISFGIEITPEQRAKHDGTSPDDTLSIDPDATPTPAP